QKAKNVLTKQSEAEKEKKEQKNRLKQSKPKGFTSRKIGMIVAWTVIGIFVLSTLSNVFFGGSNEASEDENSLQDVSFLYADGGNEFTKDFLFEFYNWTHSEVKGLEAQTDELSDYMVNDLNESIERMAFDPVWSSSINKNNIILKNIDKISNQKALMTYEVEYTLSRPTEENDSKIDKEDMTPQEYEARMKKPVYKDGVERVKTKKHVKVPLFYDDESEEFVVFDTPTYTNYSDGNIASVPKFNIESLRQVTDVNIKNNVTAFLKTFFESYAEDSQDKLSYLVNEDNIQNGLNGIMNFGEIKEFEIYAIDRNEHDRLFVNPRVVYKDKEADGVTYETNHLLVIKEEKGSYIVESIDDESYVKGIIDEYRNNRNREDEITNEEDLKRLKQYNTRDKVQYRKKSENTDESDSDLEKEQEQKKKEQQEKEQKEKEKKEKEEKEKEEKDDDEDDDEDDD